MTELAQYNVTERKSDTVTTALSYQFSKGCNFHVVDNSGMKQYQSHTLTVCLCVVSEVNMVIPLQRRIKPINISTLWAVLTASRTGPGLFLCSDILFSSSCTLVLGVHY